MLTRQSIKLSFICRQCEARFKQRVPALYIVRSVDDDPTEPEARSPFVIPQRVVCPHCQAVDRFDFSLRTNLRITLALLMHRFLPFLASRRILPMIFTVGDGRRIHPLDAIDMYDREVTAHPQQVDLRRRYANLLHNLGYVAESEVHYREVLAQAPNELRALMGLAAIYADRDDVEQTRRYLELIVERAPKSDFAGKTELLADIQPYLDGKFPLNTFETEFAVLGRVGSPELVSSPPRSASPAKKRRAKKRKQHKK